MTDIFEQVEEELRSDRYKRLARTWLPVVGGILVLALIAALGWWGWQSYESSRAANASVAYERGIEALQTNDLAAAESAFAEAEREGNGAYKSMALAQRAGLALAANRVDEAIELLDKSAKAIGDPLLSDASAYKAALLVMDTGTYEDVEGRLTPLTREGRPFRAQALEALAMAQLQHGKSTEARATFVQLQLGQDVPDTVRQRAQAAIAMIDSGTLGSLPGILEAQSAPPAVVSPEQAGAAPQAQAPAQPAPAE
ncbi:MAG: tetratricopeptide repeat protein [Alphaproteobacteria bacterium]|nr:tetratricopeptide repeat protein [Alphaproteobacteria bacterium]